MCVPHHCLGRDAFASGPEILRRLLKLRQNASILGQGCAAFSPGSANRCDQFTRHPWRTSSPLRPSLSCRYTHRSGNPKGRPVGHRNMNSLITRALNRSVTITENGKRERITKREAIVMQLVNRSTGQQVGVGGLSSNENAVGIVVGRSNRKSGARDTGGDPYANFGGRSRGQRAAKIEHGERKSENSITVSSRNAQGSLPTSNLDAPRRLPT